LDSATTTNLSGYGIRYPIGDNRTEVGRALNRRVTISIQKTLLKKKAAPPDLDIGEPNLSVQRAKAVYDYLIKHGIPKDRTQQTANRRVEIRIISK
jgi:outer membrane protein OmpA-like peptidoglycan-associated protein